MEGSESLISFECSWQGEVNHSLDHLSFASFLSFLWVADMLMGRGFLQRKVGRLCGGLDSPCAASFASSSAISLHEMPSWPGLQMNVTLHLCFSFQSFYPVLLSVSFVQPLPFLYPLTCIPLSLACTTWKALSEL